MLRLNGRVIQRTIFLPLPQPKWNGSRATWLSGKTRCALAVEVTLP